MIVGGCFLLVDTKTLKAINGFDERFFLYFEDFDFQFELAWKTSHTLGFNYPFRALRQGSLAYLYLFNFPVSTMVGASFKEIDLWLQCYRWSKENFGYRRDRIYWRAFM